MIVCVRRCTSPESGAKTASEVHAAVDKMQLLAPAR
jgi:hypothetical protein